MDPLFYYLHFQCQYCAVSVELIELVATVDMMEKNEDHWIFPTSIQVSSTSTFKGIQTVVDAT
eukprot:scaffold118453_cov66-Cyclotella_meneghiniana.AAC.5